MTHDSVKSITSLLSVGQARQAGRRMDDGKTPATVMSESMTCNFVLLLLACLILLFFSALSVRRGKRPSGITMWLASRADESVCGRGTRAAAAPDNEAGWLPGGWLGKLVNSPHHARGVGVGVAPPTKLVILTRTGRYFGPVHESNLSNP